MAYKRWLMIMNIDQILGMLDGVRGTGPDKYQSRCPSHHDTDPSFSIQVSGNKILIHCHAGCTKSEVLSSLGIKLSDLFLDENYGKACSRKIDTGVSQRELDMTVLEIAATDIKAGKSISLTDKARIKMARRRFSNG